MSADILKWVVWAGLLVAQNFSFTLVSRARNSGDLRYHAACSAFSNSLFLLCSLVLVDSAGKVMRDKDLWMGGFVLALYTASTTTGSVIGHYVSMKWLEKGKRRVGAW